MALIVRPDGSQEAPTEKLDLKTLQDYVGGWIEIVPVRTMGFSYVVVNEEGRINGLPLNQTASTLAGRELVGVAVFCGKDEID